MCYSAYWRVPPPYHVGVAGVTDGAVASMGVRGEAPPLGVGVSGMSGVGYGVFGEATMAGGIGVRGRGTTTVGVFGDATTGLGVVGTSSNNVGVFGQASVTAGVFGTSPIYGVWGRTTTGFGVNGEATGTGIGVYGKAGAGGYAGYFDGPVFVAGVGILGSGMASQAASAATEDVGRARLVDGRATVALSEDMAGSDDYHVSLTEIGDAGGLYLAGAGATGFEVRARKPGAGGAFSYRVVGKRTGSVRRAADGAAAPPFDMPKDVAVPTAPMLPKAEPPKPERREAR